VPFTVTVTATDANGNPLTSYTGTVDFGSLDLQAVLPANYTFTAADQGVHVFTLTLKTAHAPARRPAAGVPPPASAGWSAHPPAGVSRPFARRSACAGRRPQSDIRRPCAMAG
jgi:hypothetical protein